MGTAGFSRHAALRKTKVVPFAAEGSSAGPMSLIPFIDTLKDMGLQYHLGYGMCQSRIWRLARWGYSSGRRSLSWTPSAFAKRRMVDSRTSVRPCSRAGRRGCGMLTSFARSACESPAASRASLSLVPNRTASASRVPLRRTAAGFFGDAFFLGGVVTGSLSHRSNPTRTTRKSLELLADDGAAFAKCDARGHGLRRSRKGAFNSRSL